MRISNRPDHHAVRNLSEHHIFELQWSVLRAEQGSGQDSPVPPIVVNLYMEYFEERAIREAPHPPPLIHMVEIHGWYIHRASRE